MAKTQASKKVFDINAFDSFLGKEANTKGGAIDKFERTRTYISTGIYVLDAMLSSRLLGGGVPDNRITGIGGESGTGKTFLALNIVRNAILNDGYQKVYYIDTEGAIDPELVESFGIPSSKFRREPIVTVEELKIYLAKFVDKLKKARAEGYDIPKILLVIDSLGNIPSKKETEEAIAGTDKRDMTKEQVLASIFRIVTSDLEDLNIPMVLTNHTYFTRDMFPKEVFKGGNGPVYNCSTIILLSKAKLKEDTMDEFDLGQTGIIVTAKAIKNRMAKPKKVKFSLSFNGGANPYYGLEEFCTIENFGKIGIAKGKKFIDTETGEVTVKEGGNMWYIRHLDKHIAGKFLNTSKIFTQAVLENMNEVMHDYFRYKSREEIERIHDELEEMRVKTDENPNVLDLSADDLDAGSLFE